MDSNDWFQKCTVKTSKTNISDIEILIYLYLLKIGLLTPLYYMYTLYHILGRHAILMLCLNLMLGPTYLPYFFWHQTGTTHIFHLGLIYYYYCSIY